MKKKKKKEEKQQQHRHCQRSVQPAEEGKTHAATQRMKIPPAKPKRDRTTSPRTKTANTRLLPAPVYPDPNW